MSMRVAAINLPRSDSSRATPVATVMLVLLMAATAQATELTFVRESPQVDCGTTVYVDVVVDAVSDLRGFRLDFTYGPAVLAVTSVVPGGAIGGAGCGWSFHAYPTVGGVLRVDAGGLGCSLNGGGSLVRVGFEPASAKGDSDLGFGTVLLRNSHNVVISTTLVPSSLANWCNAAPVATDAAFSLAENSPAGAVVGTVAASDSDAADVLSYAITGGNQAGAFAIASATGQITVTASAPLDFETTPTFALTVTVTDNDPHQPKSDLAVITVNLTNVNEPPVLDPLGSLTSTVLEVVSLSPVGHDPESQPLAWTATGLPSGLTIQQSSGVISGTIACGAEAPSPYAVQVTATDDGAPPLSTSVSFTWTVHPLAAPAALASLTATQVLAGNDSDGTTKIAVAWPPVPAGQVVKIYRRGYGAYPEYDDAGGAVPTPPASQADLAGWTPVTLADGLDDVATRDFWYYVAFVENACGASSGPSPMTGGTLNYHLGDVAPLEVAPPYGDNRVDTPDISALGGHYGTASTDTTNFLDVGPTTDFAVSSLPTTDNQIEFEDLIVFAINYGGVGKDGGPDPAERNLVTVVVPDRATADRLEVGLWFAGAGTIRAASIPLTWDADVVQPIAVAAGELAGRQSGPTLVLAPRPGTVDIGLFGDGEVGLSGQGCIATVTFAVVGAGDPHLGVGELRTRDAQNRPCELAAEVAQETPAGSDIPATSVLHAAHPNPFNPATTLRFGLAHAGPATLRIFDLSGRLVATLMDEVRPAGTYDVVWNGMDACGQLVASGTYIARLVAADATQVQRMTLVK